ncbi:hydrogenase maturation nickel metallochaperone HypA/HybF [Gordonibacter sp. An230]|uniref:hydrogenase maturation nickel metallochaperone HypA/HybF n=1 Tax=Gordonibacter sp. An230 TaxID=1965592 RepID=UPI0013A67997|nr:hydrogenase maturation nickel metallochaperone HypA [Gordonibacter sp. An230]
MHEMALVHGVVDAVLEHAGSIGAGEVTSVFLTVGQGRDVVEEYMQGLFAFLSKGTVAEHARLIVDRTPFAVRCNRCGSVFPIDVFDSSTWECPRCGAERDYRLHSGMEFTIDRIEVVGRADSGHAQADTGDAAFSASSARCPVGRCASSVAGRSMRSRRFRHVGEERRGE